MSGFLDWVSSIFSSGKDPTLDTTSNILLGVPSAVWVVLAGLAIVVAVKKFLDTLPFKPIAFGLAVILVIVLIYDKK